MLSRRYWLLLAVVLLGIAGYTVYWFTLSHRIERGFEEWTLARIGEGYDVKFAGYKVGGFPGRLLLTVDKPEMSDPRHHAAWSWSGERVVAYAQPWNLKHVIVDLGLVQEFAWSQGETRHRLKAVATSAKASMVFQGDGALDRADADIAGLALSGAGLSQTVTAERVQVHQRRNYGETQKRPRQSFDLAVQVDKLNLPPDRAGALGPFLQLVRAELQLQEPLPHGPEDLTAWRDGGGSIDVNRYDLIWGPLSMRGEGTLALDKQMRLLAALSAEMRGWAETIDLLTEKGRIKPNFARTAKSALQLLAKPGADGKSTLNVPVTAQDVFLYVGPLQLMELEPLPMISGRKAP